MVHKDQPVGHGEGLVTIVSDVDRGYAHLLKDSADLTLKGVPQRPVQRSQRLVKH